MHSNSFLLEILNRALDGETLDHEAIAFLLGLSRPDDVAALFRTARHLRRRHFGDHVFLYGFLYFSTFCRNNCRFCQFRRDNVGLARYRKSPSEVLFAARKMAASGVHLIDLTMGEDPRFYNPGGSGFQDLIEIVESIRRTTSLPVMISPGVVPESVLGALAAAGADWYACYQETYNPVLFNSLRSGQRFEERMARKQSSRKYGFLVEEGLLCGVGESVSDIADGILAMKSIQVDQARAMTFVSHAATPLQSDIADPMRELMTIAVMRLVLADCLIPASLDVGGVAGLKQRLQAGANVVTSLVPPGIGLAGVANATLDIEDAKRTPKGISATLSECGLRIADRNRYLTWMESRRKGIKGDFMRKAI